MARLEFEFIGIDSGFKAEIDSRIADLDKLKGKFESLKNVKIGSGGSGSNAFSDDLATFINNEKAKQEVAKTTFLENKALNQERLANSKLVVDQIRQAESDNAMFIKNNLAEIKNAHLLQVNDIVLSEKSKQEAAKTTALNAKASIQEQIEAGKKLDNQNKVTRNSIQSVNLELKKMALEAKKNAKTQKSAYNDTPYAKVTRELNEMRNEAKNLGAQMILLENAGMKTSAIYNTLENKLKDLQNPITKLDSQIKSLDGSLGQYQRNVGNYQQAMRGANGVAMEFNRIIQDAPFGMMGVANNIQQLTENWKNYSTQMRQAAAANNTTVSTTSLLQGALRSIFSPLNALPLLISTVTSAWVYYQMNNRSVNESVQELNNSFVNQMGVLKNVISLTELSAKTERDKATAISIYNKELGDTLGKVKTYKELEGKLIKQGDDYVKYLSLKARAEGVYQLSLEKTKKLFNDVMKLTETSRAPGISGWIVKNIENPANKLSNKIWSSLGVIERGDVIEKITQEEALNIIGLPSEKEFNNVLKNYSASIRHALTKFRKEEGRNKETSDLFAKLTQQANAVADALGGIKMPDLGLDKDKKKKVAAVKEIFDYLGKINEILSGKQKDLDLFGKTGLEKDLLDLKYSFSDAYKELDKLSDKLSKDKSVKDKTIISASITQARELLNELKELNRLEILAENRRKLEDVFDKAKSDAGYIETDSLEKRLETVANKFKQHMENAVKYSANPLQTMFDITLLKMTAINNATDKWNNEQLVSWGKINDKIQEALDKPFNSRNRNSVQRELDNRIFILKNLLQDLSSAMGIKFDEAEFRRLSGIVRKNADEAVNVVNRKEITEALKPLFVELVDEFKNISFSFKSVVGMLTRKIESTADVLNKKSQERLFDDLSKAFSKTMDENGEKYKVDWDNAKWAITGMMGNIVKGISGGSAAGEIAGGALSGAAAGGSTGNVWAAVGGAVLGAVGGIFKASEMKAQRKEQRRMVEEQRKTNALLERMNALTYASQIIGSRTKYGIVSGVNRNEFGDITFRINGKDIVGSVGRTGELTNR